MGTVWWILNCFRDAAVRIIAGGILILLGFSPQVVSDYFAGLFASPPEWLTEWWGIRLWLVLLGLGILSIPVLWRRWRENGVSQLAELRSPLIKIATVFDNVMFRVSEEAINELKPEWEAARAKLIEIEKSNDDAANLRMYLDKIFLGVEPARFYLTGSEGSQSIVALIHKVLDNE